MSPFALLVLSGALVAAPEEAPPHPSQLKGEVAPLFVLPTLNPEAGLKRFVMRDWVGDTARTPKKRVLLSFSASWCGPCREELARLGKLAPKLEAAGVGVAVVVIDNTDEGIHAMDRLTTEELKLPFPVLKDRFQVLAKRYRVGKLPLSVVTDAEGVITFVHEGFSESGFEALTAQLLGSPAS